MFTEVVEIGGLIHWPTSIFNCASVARIRVGLQIILTLISIQTLHANEILIPFIIYYNSAHGTKIQLTHQFYLCALQQF